VTGIIVFKINLGHCLDNWTIAMIYVSPEDNAGSFDAADTLTYHEKVPWPKTKLKNGKKQPVCVTASGRLE